LLNTDGIEESSAESPDVCTCRTERLPNILPNAWLDDL